MSDLLHRFWDATVGQLGLQCPDLVEQQPFCLGVVAVVADHDPYDRPVLLLDVAAVVLVARPRPGEGDLAFLAPGQQVMIDELRSIVTVYAQDRERHRAGDVVERGEHPFAGLVAHAAVLRPAGGDVGDGQRPGVLTGGVAAVVGDQVDLDEPGHRVVPVRPGPDRDLALQQRAGFGARAALQLVLAPFAGQAPGRWWPPTCPPAAPRCPRRCPARRTDAGSPPARPASAPTACPSAYPMSPSRRSAPQRLSGHTSAAAAPAAEPPAAATPRAAPCGRGRDATQWSRTTRPESSPYRPCPPACSGSRSSSSPPCARPSSIPSTSGNAAFTLTFDRHAGRGQSQMNQRIRL